MEQYTKAYGQNASNCEPFMVALLATSSQKFRFCLKSTCYSPCFEDYRTEENHSNRTCCGDQLSANMAANYVCIKHNSKVFG